MKTNLKWAWTLTATMMGNAFVYLLLALKKSPPVLATMLLMAKVPYQLCIYERLKWSCPINDFIFGLQVSFFSALVEILLIFVCHFVMI